MVVFCVVEGCENKKSLGFRVKYFSLPSEPSTRALWLELCGRKGQTVPTSARVCSEHFPPSFHSWTCQRLGEQENACGCSPKGLFPTLKLPAKAINPQLLENLQSHKLKRKLPFDIGSCQVKRQRLPLQVQNGQPTPESNKKEDACDDVLHFAESSFDESTNDKENVLASQVSTASHISTRPPASSIRIASVQPLHERSREVDLVLVSHERVPPHVLSADAAAQAGLQYAALGQDELIQKLLERDKQLQELRLKEELLNQTIRSREQELEDFKKCKAERDLLRNTVRDLTAQNSTLRDRLKKAWAQGREAGLQEASKALEGVFSDKQIQCLITGKRVVWSPEDLASAIALHSCSPKAYKFIRATMKLPLPSDSTVRRWAAKLEIKAGLQSQVLVILEKIGQTMAEKERLVCLSFDEMSLSQRVQYDGATDSIMGPHAHAQVAFIRSLVGSWKQPVYFDFDEEMTKKTFEDICSALFKIGFIVVASVCDLGSTNQSFLRSMGVFDTDQYFCQHPSDSSLPIFFFADAPHMLKLLRNHILDQGLNLPDGYFKHQILKTTINLMSRNQLRAADKLHQGLLDLNSKARMRVLPAVQLLSNTMATSMRHLFKKGLLKDKDAPVVADFVQLANDWFDVFNSRASAKSSDGLKQEFGADLQNQTQILNRMITVMNSMRVKGHHSLLPFQRGIIMSSNSLPLLFQHLKTKYKVEHFPTSRINQDCAESFFSWTRAAGAANTTPTALDFTYRFKKYLLSKTTTHYAEQANCTQDENMNICATALIFKSTDDADHNLIAEAVQDLRDNCPDDTTGPTDKEIFPQSPSDDDDVEFDGLSGQGLHHKSQEFERVLDTLARNNGIVTMAGFLAAKCSVAEAPDNTLLRSLNTSMLSEREFESLRTKEWLVTMVKLMEDEFVNFHGPALSKFNRNRGVNRILSDIIVKKINCDKTLADKFVRTRLSMRIRDYNLPIRNATLNCTNKSYLKYYAK